jgi:hypothetical protein
VGEAGGGACLADEPGHERPVVTVDVAEAGVHYLDRDGAVESLVVGAVDAGHPTPRDARCDPVAAVEHPADQGVAGRLGLRRLADASTPV